MKTVMKKTDARTKKQRRAGGIITGVLVVAVLLFLLAGLSIYNEISHLQAQLDDQRASLDDSLNKSITAYMETKYLGTTNENGRVAGEIDFTELSDEEMQQIMAAIMNVLDQYLTDEVYTGASKLAANELRSSINDAINKALASMGLSSSTLSDEITALVLQNLQANLEDYKKNILENASDLSGVSGDVYNLDTKISNLDSSIAGLKSNYDATIAALKKTDEQLAARIDALMKDANTSQSEYDKKVSELVNQMSVMNQTINNNANTATNNYNQNVTDIQNLRNSVAASDEDLANRIDNLQNALNSYIENGAVAGSITPRTDGGSGNKLTLIVPD